MNVHDKARALAAQSPRPMDLRAAYSKLSRRRKNYGKTTVALTPDLLAERTVRLPYRDD